MLYQSFYSSPLGRIVLISDDKALLGLWFEGQKRALREGAVTLEALPLKKAKVWLDGYFLGRKMETQELPLAPQGSEFCKIVWRILQDIPYGQTTTYGVIAKQVAFVMNKPKMSAQAVGQAVARNPIAIIIPCHRVMGAKGNLTGYAGGLDKKVKLLGMERQK